MSPSVFLALVAVACVRVYFVSGPVLGTARRQRWRLRERKCAVRTSRGTLYKCSRKCARVHCQGDTGSGNSKIEGPEGVPRGVGVEQVLDGAVMPQGWRALPAEGQRQDGRADWPAGLQPRAAAGPRAFLVWKLLRGEKCGTQGKGPVTRSPFSVAPSLLVWKAEVSPAHLCPECMGPPRGTPSQCRGSRPQSWVTKVRVLPLP